MIFYGVKFLVICPRFLFDLIGKFNCRPVRFQLSFRILRELDNNSCNFIYRYNSATGTFTVPSGGDGFYYFSVFLTTISIEVSYFDLEINGTPLCSAVGELTQMYSGDEIGVSCSGVAYVTAGKILHIFLFKLLNYGDIAKIVYNLRFTITFIFFVILPV